MSARGFRGLALLALAVAVPAFAAQAGAWTDRGEYDLVLTIRAEATPQKRIELLDEWKKKYPKSDMRQVRRELYLSAFQAEGDSARMLDTAREMLADEPGNFVGAYWCAVLIPESQSPSPEALEAARTAAHLLVESPGTYFAPARKPAGTSDAEWQKQRDAAQLLAHRALGWVAWQRQDYPTAEQEFTAYLQKDAGKAEISAWLGMVLALEKAPEKQVAGIWQMAHAISVKDAGALPDSERRQMTALVEQVYTSYHGEAAGLEDFEAAAAKAAFPAADFNIDPAALVNARHTEDETAKTNPELAAWMRIHRQLTAADGDKFFETLRAAPLPHLKGTVLRTVPAGKPTQVVLAVSQPEAEEVILKLSAPMPNDAARGTLLEFDGAVDSFNKDPFSLTVNVDPDKITGWPPRGRR